MLTKTQINFLLEIYNNNGKITSKEQKSYTCKNTFYQTITKLTRMKLINSYLIQIDEGDKRINIYELTLRGLTLIKILLGEDY